MYAIPLLCVVIACFLFCYLKGLFLSGKGERRAGHKWALASILIYCVSFMLFLNRPNTEWQREPISGKVTLTHMAKHPHSMMVSFTRQGVLFNEQLGSKVLLIPDATEPYVISEKSLPRDWYQGGVPVLHASEVHVSPQDLLVSGGQPNAVER